MVKHWTDKELTAELKNLTIICDTREQDRHVTEWLEKNKVQTITRKLDTGDYSCQLGDQHVHYVSNCSFSYGGADVLSVLLSSHLVSS